MQQKGTGAVFRTIVFALTALMICFAFYHSAMPAYESTEESEGLLYFIINFFSGLGISVELTDQIIRKAAHFSEYFLIGGLMLTCAYSLDRFKTYRFIIQVLFFGLLSAVIDETIQLFSIGRSGQISDVLLDFSGVIAGAGIMLLFWFIVVKIKHKKGNKR